MSNQEAEGQGLLDRDAEAAGLEPATAARAAQAPRKFALSVLVVVALALNAMVMLTKLGGGGGAQARPRNLIFMLGDGMGAGQLTLARHAARLLGRPGGLALDGLATTLVGTRSSSSYVTDSAAGGSAYSTAQRTYNHAIAVDARGRAVATLLEAARSQGMTTGLVSTSRVTHATPASFSAHALHRNDETLIAEQQASSGLDVVLGGGRQFFLPNATGRAQKGKRIDGRNLLDEMRAAGYSVVDTELQLRRVMGSGAQGPGPAAQRPKKLLGLFAPSHLDFELDRRAAAAQFRQPSLSAMVTSALQVLSANGEEKGKGFAMLIEGSRIDQASHVGDAASTVADLLAYDDAVQVALEFAKKDGERTLIVSVADHETGGLSLGRDVHVGADGTPHELDVSDPRRPEYEFHPEQLVAVKRSMTYLAHKCHEDIHAELISAERVANCTTDRGAVRAAMEMSVCLVDELQASANVTCTALEKSFLRKTSLAAFCAPGGHEWLPTTLAYGLSTVINVRAKIGFTTRGHTGVDIPLFASGPGCAALTAKRVRNDEAGAMIARLFGFDLGEETVKLRAAMTKNGGKLASEQFRRVDSTDAVRAWLKGST